MIQSIICTIITAVIFAAVFYNWPAICSWFARMWRYATGRGTDRHYAPGQKRNNLDLFGDVDTSQTRSMFDE